MLKTTPRKKYCLLFAIQFETASTTHYQWHEYTNTLNGSLDYLCSVP